MAEETEFYFEELLPAIKEAKWEQVGRQGNSRLFRRVGEKDLHIPFADEYKLDASELAWLVRRFKLGEKRKK